MIYYDFLDNWEDAEPRLRSLGFEGVVNPVDGVTYPGISTIPDDIADDIDTKLRAAFPSYRKRFQFARLSVDGVEAPHQVHNDITMGQRTAILYCSSEGGTSVVSHAELGFGYQPASEAEHAAWAADVNRPEAWRVDMLVPAYPNKLAIYPADRMHRSEPVGGFGVDSADGRLVVVTFFDVE